MMSQLLMRVPRSPISLLAAAAVVILAAGVAIWITQVEAQPPCESGTVVRDPENRPDLVADCKALLAAKDALRGTAPLDWPENRPISEWEGVSLTSDGSRVGHLRLADQGLTGRIPPELGNLRALTTLSLSGNQLTSRIPPELGNLTALTTLSLSGNRFTGCFPDGLRGVSSAERDRLGLPLCSAMPLELVVVSDGAPDALLLEWTGGSSGVVRWQYRHRVSRFGTWGTWQDIPGSSNTTGSYRLSGLVNNWPYYFEVRPVTGSGPGHASPTARGVPPRHDEGIPELTTGTVAEGGRIWLLAGNIELEVPAGVRLTVCGGGVADGPRGGYVMVTICEISSGSWLSFDAETGEADRGIGAPGEVGGAAEQHVNTVFDHLLDTLTLRGHTR